MTTKIIWQVMDMGIARMGYGYGYGYGGGYGYYEDKNHNKISYQAINNISFFLALSPIYFYRFSPIMSIYGENSLGGPNQIALLFSAAIAIIIGIINGQWKNILNTIGNSISSTTSAIIILLLIGYLLEHG